MLRRCLLAGVLGLTVVVTLTATPTVASAGSPDGSRSDSYPAPVVTSISPATGPATGGTTVTVTGTDLTGATAVDFGADPATITSGSATSITSTAPAGTGTVDVTVTTAGGTSATTAGDQFTYTTPCQPGSYSATGDTPCTLAPLSTYVDSVGATSPTPCPAGTYTYFQGATSAAQCIVGSVSTVTCAVTGSESFGRPGLSAGGSLTKRTELKTESATTPTGTGCSGAPMRLVIHSATTPCPETNGVPDAGDPAACTRSTTKMGVTTYAIATKPYVYDTSASYATDGASDLAAALRAKSIMTVINNIKFLLVYGTVAPVLPGGVCGGSGAGFELTGIIYYRRIMVPEIPMGTYDERECITGDSGPNTTGNFAADLQSSTASVASVTFGGASALIVTLNP